MQVMDWGPRHLQFICPFSYILTIFSQDLLNSICVNIKHEEKLTTFIAVEASLFQSFSVEASLFQSFSYFLLIAG